MIYSKDIMKEQNNSLMVFEKNKILPKSTTELILLMEKPASSFLGFFYKNKAHWINQIA